MRPVRHALLRALLALLSLFAAAAPATAAVGEGVLASRAGRSPVAVHVEDARRAQCPYVHADDCVLCAVLGIHALPGTARPAGASSTIARQAVVVPEAAVRAAHHALDARHARGPPTG